MSETRNLWQRVMTPWQVQGRLTPQTGLRDQLMFLAGCSLALVPHMVALPPAFGFILGLLVLWRFALHLSGRGQPPHWLIALLSLASVGGVFGWYGTLAGKAPGTTLLALLTALKLLELHSRRDHLIVITLGLFCVMTSFLHPTGMVGYAMGAVASILLLGAQSQLVATHQPRSSLWHAVQVGWLGVQGLPMAALLMLILPAMPTMPWSSDESTASAGTGMSETMTPGDIGKLVESNGLVMRIRFSGLVPAQELLYFRGPVLSHFDGRTWSSPPEPPPALIRQSSVSTQGPRSRTASYRVWLEPQPMPYLFALDVPVAHHADRFVTHLTSLGQVMGADGSDDTITYTARALPGASWGETSSLPDAQRWLQLPKDHNPMTRQWAQALRESLEAPEPLDIVTHVLEHFRQENFYYTLEPGALGQHPVDEFMFSRRKGFCEHYAGAFVFILRAAGVPARVVTGYQGGESDSLSDDWLVRQRDAHAWAEVWLEGQGWTRVDPTSAVAPERIQNSAASLSARNRPAILRWLGEIDDRLGAYMAQLGHRAVSSRWLARLEDGVQAYGKLLQLVLVMVSLCLFSAGAVYLHRALRPPQKRAWRLYRGWCRDLANHQLAPQAHETPLDHANRVANALASRDKSQSAMLARQIAAVYSLIRYDPGSDRETETRRLALMIREFGSL